MAAVVICALTVQVTLLARFSFEGARPDLMVLVAVLAGYIGGPNRGAIVGFSAGVVFDILLSTPMGLSALIYTLLGYGIGSISSGMVRSSRIAPVLVAVAGSAIGVVGFAVAGEVLGEATLKGPNLAAIVVYVATINAVAAPLMMKALSWAMSSDNDQRSTYAFR